MRLGWSRRKGQRGSDFANYTARYYPSAKPDGPVRIDDDKRRDQLTVFERYVLDRAFVVDEQGKRELLVHADELYSFAEPLSSTVRRGPLAVAYPANARQHITVYLPEPWQVRAVKVKVENPAFRYEGAVDYARQVLTLDYEYQALSDHVALLALKQYLVDRKRMYDDLGYLLSYKPEAASVQSLAIAPLPLFVYLMVLALAVWGAIRWVYRLDPPGRAIPEGAPVGIAGWLILPAVGVIVAPFLTVWALVEWSSFIRAETWYGLDSIVREGSEGWARPGVLLIGAMSTGLLVLQILLSVLFFRRRTTAPAVYMAVIWLGLLSGMAALTWVQHTGLDAEMQMSREIASMVRDTLQAIIWTAYFLSSRRVHATFQKRLGARTIAASRLAVVPAPSDAAYERPETI